MVGSWQRFVMLNVRFQPIVEFYPLTSHKVVINRYMIPSKLLIELDG